MPVAIRDDTTIAAGRIQPFPTGISTVDFIYSGIPDLLRADWQSVIDKLNSWDQHPELFHDEGLTPPSEYAVRMARDLAIHLARQGLSAPSRSIPDGDGGIVFERWEGTFCVRILIPLEGPPELSIFDGATLLAHDAISTGLWRM